MNYLLLSNTQLPFLHLRKQLFPQAIRNPLLRITSNVHTKFSLQYNTQSSEFFFAELNRRKDFRFGIRIDKGIIGAGPAARGSFTGLLAGRYECT